VVEVGHEHRPDEDARAERTAGSGSQPEAAADGGFTGPQSRIMPKGGSFQQSYNAQVAVDAQTQLIVTQQVGQR
jgi:hypothetical protein